MIEADRFDENTFRIKFNVDYNDLSNRVSMVVKEIKQSA
jgi:hypothetical protein